MLTDYTPVKKDLFCVQHKNKKRDFNGYRGFRLPSVKLLFEYIFSGFILKIEQNNRELRYDVFLVDKHKETKENINLKEVERCKNFFGKGFNITIFSEAQIGFID